MDGAGGLGSGGLAGEHQRAAVVPHGREIGVSRGLQQRVVVGALADEAAQPVIDGQDLEHRAASVEAGVAALGTALAAVEGDVRIGGQLQQRQLLVGGAVGLFAVGTDAPHQPLGDDAAQGVGDKVRLHADVHQTGNGGYGVVGVQRGQHQMSGDGGADGDRTCLAVADLAHRDNIGVLAQDGAQARGKGHTGLFIDLALADAGDVVFHGVLQRHDVGLLAAQLQV